MHSFSDFLYVHKKIETHNNTSPKTSDRVTLSFQNTRLTKSESNSELLPISVVIETVPVLIAAVLNKRKHVCATPYIIPQNITYELMCRLQLFTKNNKTHHTKDHRKLNLKTVSFLLAPALFSTTLLNEAARTDIPKRKYISFHHLPFL